MTNDPLLRTLPVALALTLIALTALWGGWLVGQGFLVIAAPFAVVAAIWPALSVASWRTALSNDRSEAASPQAERETSGEPGAEFAGLLER